jgi:hypothetical protein
VAWRDDRHRIPAIGGADGSPGLRTADLGCDLAVRSRLAERNGQQSVPHLSLERCPGDVQLQRERLPLAGEVLGKLTLRFHQHGMGGLLAIDVQPDPARTVVFPQDGSEAVIRGDQLEPADW